MHYFGAIALILSFRRVRKLSLRTCCGIIGVCWLWSGPLGAFRFILGIKSPIFTSMLLGAVQFGPLGYLHVFISGVVAARVFVLVGTLDAATGEAPTASTKKLVLRTHQVPPLFRYGCLLGYLIYLLLVGLDAVVVRGALQGLTPKVETGYYTVENVYSGMVLNVAAAGERF